MSSIQDDKKVLQKGRKNALKDAKAELRDQIVRKLVAKLEEDQLGIKMSNIWDAGNANRAEWIERQREYMAGWDDYIPADAQGSFDGSSNLHLPTLFIVVKTLHARFLQAILGVDPPFNVKARTEADVDRVQMISDTMRYTIKEWANKYSGIEQEIDKWVWAWVSTGSGIIKWGWDVEYTKYLDVQTVQQELPPRVKIGPDGQEILVPRKKSVEEEVEVTKKIFEGPVCKHVAVEDLLIIGGEGDPDKADVVIHQDYLTSSQLWTLADRKIFDYDAVERVINSGGSMEISEDRSGLKQHRAKNSGQAAPDNDNDHDRYQILECYIKYDVDGSGIFSDIVMWVHKKTGAVLRATYLRRINKAGERPFKKIDFHVRNEQEYGVGIVEILYPLAKELDAMHNMRIDFGLVSTMPFGFYRPSSSLNPETIQLEPGALIPVDNPSTDVMFPNLGNRTTFGMQEEQAIQTMIDRVTSISDLNLGVMSGGQGATRTATGTRALVGESSANLDVFLRRLNRGWRRSLQYLLHLLQQRIPNGLSFRVTGDAGNDYWRTVRDAKDLEGNFDIEVSENSSASNPQVRQDIAQQILQVTSNPLDIQLQLVTPGNRYEAVKNYLQALGVKEWGRYVQKPQGYSLSLSPEEEANRILRGIDVPVRPEMDHDGFIEFFNMIYNSDELLGQFNEQQTILLAQQANKHEQMKKAMAFAQAQAANAAQMQMNSAQSMQQTGQNAAGAAPAPGGQAGQPAPVGTQQA